MSVSEFLELFADLIISSLALTIGWLFWRTYTGRHDKRSRTLAVVFIFLAAFKLVQFFADVLGVTGLAWMDSVLAAEAWWIITLGTTVTVLLAGTGWRGAQLKNPDSERSSAA